MRTAAAGGGEVVAGVRPQFKDSQRVSPRAPGVRVRVGNEPLVRWIHRWKRRPPTEMLIPAGIVAKIVAAAGANGVPALRVVI